MAAEELNKWFHYLTVDIKEDEKRLLRIEIYMSIVVLLFICLAFFGWFRRTSGSHFVRICLWAAFSSFYATLTYSLGLMSSAPFNNDLFAIWAIVIFYMLDSTDSITAYSLQDNEHVYRCLWETFMAVIYVGIVVASNSKDSSLRISIWVLFLACLARPCIKFCALYLASKTSSWLSEATRVINDFMYEEHKITKSQAQGEGDKDDSEAEKDLKNKNRRKKKNREEEHPFFDLRGYHYIVKGDSERKAKLNEEDFKYSMLKEAEWDVITVHEIWSKSDRFPSDSTGRLKEHCLSFALFKMLRRRFAGYCLGECTCPEARDKTWAFVADGLLKKMDDQKSWSEVSKRVFGIVELEMAFVFDFFYTKYAAMLEKGFPWWKSFAEVILLVYAILISVKLDTDKSIDLLIHPGYDNKAMVNAFGTIVTHIVLYGFSATLLLQFYALLNSNWMKVWLLCKHFYTKSPLIQSTIRKVLFLVRYLQFGNLWSNMIGQHDLLVFPSHTLGRQLERLFPTIMTQIRHLPVPEEVKIEVLITLKKHGRSLTDGLHSGLPGRDRRKWTCELTEIGIAFNILVWHIATSLMLTDHPVDNDSSTCTSTLFAWLKRPSNNKNRHRKVARILSNYCAYLVVSHPELLPDNACSTKLIYDNTRADLLHLLEKHGSLKKLFEDVMACPKEHPALLVKAAELHKKLKDEFEAKKDEPEPNKRVDLLWNVLSDYWTEMVLYLAPCDNPEEHIKSLTRGGEFITHLWALLTHAGVLKRVPQHDHNPYNRETDYQQI